MMIFGKQPELAQPRKRGTPLPPAWLKLEPGEKLLASYQGKQITEILIYASLAVLGLCIVAALVVMLLGEGGKSWRAF